jgi:hypothetical protein
VIGTDIILRTGGKIRRKVKDAARYTRSGRPSTLTCTVIQISVTGTTEVTYFFKLFLKCSSVVEMNHVKMIRKNKVICSLKTFNVVTVFTIGVLYSLQLKVFCTYVSSWMWLVNYFPKRTSS